MEKKWVKVGLETLTCDFFEGDIDQIIDSIELLKSKYSGFINLQIEANYQYDYTEFELQGERKETDEEYTKRMIAREKNIQYQLKRKVALEEKERKQLEKLKAKYELHNG